MKKEEPIVVIHLSRFGCTDYALSILERLPEAGYKTFVSKYLDSSLSGATHTVRTYRSSIEAVFSSMIILPFFVMQLILLNQKSRIKAAYFPAFHHWNLPLLYFFKKLKVKTTISVHDGILHEGENSGFNSRVQQKCMALADNLIFLTHFVRQSVDAVSSKKDRTFVIPHPPIDLPGPYIHRHHNPVPSILFLGRLQRYKGIEVLMEALESLPEESFSHLTIAGKKLSEFKLPQNPKILSIEKWLSKDEMVSLLNTHDILVLPYSQATQSGIIAWGISAAIPMICTKVGGLPEQLSDNEAVWVNFSPESLKNGILALSRDKQLYVSIHRRLLQKKTSYDWPKMINQLTQILQA